MAIQRAVTVCTVLLLVMGTGCQSLPEPKTLAQSPDARAQPVGEVLQASVAGEQLTKSDSSVHEDPNQETAAGDPAPVVVNSSPIVEGNSESVVGDSGSVVENADKISGSAVEISVPVVGSTTEGRNSASIEKKRSSGGASSNSSSDAAPADATSATASDAEPTFDSGDTALPQQHPRHSRSGFLTSLNFDGEDGVLPTQRVTSTMCGVRHSSVPDLFTRIVGGSTAESNEFPWQASLQWRYSWYSYHVCGASVISERWVLTAAHCTHQFKPTEMMIIAGVNNIVHMDGSQQKREIDTVAEHYAYSPSTQENDIALLRMTEPFVIDGLKVAPVCLPAPNHKFKASCVVSGWGKKSENGGNTPDELRKVVVPIITRQQCKEAYRVIGYSGPISDKMICAGYTQGRKDACQGDSGGPFVCRGRDNKYTLAGVVSWGVGCARPNVPGVYTEVSRYTTWIRDTVRRADSFVTTRAANVQTSLHLEDIVNSSGNGSMFEQEPAAVPYTRPHTRDNDSTTIPSLQSLIATEQEDEPVVPDDANSDDSTSEVKAGARARPLNGQTFEINKNA